MNDFIKTDLRSGDVLLHRNGEVSIVISELEMSIFAESRYDLRHFKQDLTYVALDGRDFDIMEVRRPTRQEHCCFDAFKYNMGDLMYKREEI